MAASYPQIRSHCASMWEIHRAFLEQAKVSIVGTRYAALMALRAAPGFTMRYGELEHKLGKPHKTLQNVVGELVSLDLCSMRSDDNDRRFRVITLTARGLEILGDHVAHVTSTLGGASLPAAANGD
jgi:DNA-binding MarR family transcriptional regulator